jgi:4-hydroxy-tetrahydrodipicolinate synthase
MPVTLFGQVVTAMVTPFTQDGQVDYAVAEQLAAHLVAHGSDGLVLCGTTGESPTLTWDEEYQLFQVVKQAIAGRAKILAGTGSNSTREAAEATRKAADLGLDGALLVVPYYNKPPQEGLYEHFKATLRLFLTCPSCFITFRGEPAKPFCRKPLPA